MIGTIYASLLDLVKVQTHIHCRKHFGWKCYGDLKPRTFWQKKPAIAAKLIFGLLSIRVSTVYTVVVDTVGTYIYIYIHIYIYTYFQHIFHRYNMYACVYVNGTMGVSITSTLSLGCCGRRMTRFGDRLKPDM